ncbi:MAG: hypothetical protein VX938_09375, partial [Myxococcota bacterium]|nr:hypothetical protein [Myxococcota bacterium]
MMREGCAAPTVVSTVLLCGLLLPACGAGESPVVPPPRESPQPDTGELSWRAPESGQDASGPGDAVTEPEEPPCEALTCEDKSVECGVTEDGCGVELECGPCPSSQACVQGRCVQALCAGHCGLGAQGCEDDCSCWCDAECFQVGDCCEDVCASCGEWFGDNCCASDCSGKVCGDDGCGGSCGSCSPGTLCEDGVCEPCTALCDEKECGDDGCGGVCGVCIQGWSCEEGTCVECEPDCGPLGGVVLEVTPVPEEFSIFQPFFSGYVNVFGVNVFATGSVPDAKVLHAANVLAQYLDNDEDGSPDDLLVLSAMVDQPGGSSLVMFGSSWELETSGIFDSPIPGLYAAQDLQGDETHPEGSSLAGGFDATLEEVWHLVSSQGYAQAYPGVFGEAPDTTLSDAMDLARGGHFVTIPTPYPEEAWYHYDDWTCDYGCMVTEYFYWALTSHLGAQSY